MTEPTLRHRYPIDRLVLILIGGVVFSAAWSIASAEWMPRLDLLGLTVVAGLALGTIVVARPWRTSVAHTIMILYGVIWVTLMALDQMPDKVYGWTSLDTLRHMIVRLGEHIYIWGEAVITGGVGTDNTIFLLFLGTVFWLITYVAVWNTFRQPRMWRAVAPAGVVLLINTYYYGGPESLYLLVIVYLFGVLMYAARMYTLKQAERWRFSRIRYNPEIKRDFLQIGSSIAIAAVLFGSFAPTVLGAPQISDLWRQISRPVRSVEESFNRLFSGLQPNGLAFANPFGRTLALLGSRNLGNEMVMEVKSSEARYWQAVVYDEYTGTAFQSSDTTRLAVDPNERPFEAQFQQRTAVTQTFTVFFPNNTLVFAAPQAAAVDRAAWVETYPIEAAGQAAGGTPDVSMWTVINPLSAGDSYQVTSLSSVANVVQLRSAGTDYPAAIKQRYLQLPNSLPNRVRELARQISREAEATNPFDAATALEFYLRTQIKYNEKILAPAPGIDGVDYLLFDVKEGYCDYYASAMAVMARSLGIPARIATGYTQGTYDATRGVYQVFQFNAHTWAEVYFPDYGWVQFEPTASQPSLVRLQPSSANNANADTDASDRESNFRSREPIEEEFDPLQGPASPLNLPETSAATQAASPWPWVIGGAVLVVVVVAAVAAMYVYEARGSNRRARRGGAWAFARMARMAQWLRVKLAPWQTPYEQAQALSKIMPHNEPAIERVASLYVYERYGRGESEPLEAQVTWRSLRGPMWWAGFKRRLPRSLPSFRRIFRRSKPVEP
ncbi:MAG: transglutaminase domain-containing protein [Thermoflexales bacterium]|nr:transglutaminase domain-containing protein [Thermoflexales bacterium]